MAVETKRPPFNLHDVISYVFVRDHPQADRVRAFIERQDSRIVTATFAWDEEQAQELTEMLDAAERSKLRGVKELRGLLTFVQKKAFTAHLMRCKTAATFEILRRAVTELGIRAPWGAFSHVSTPTWVHQISALLKLDRYYEHTARCLALCDAHVAVEHAHVLKINGAVRADAAVAKFSYDAIRNLEAELMIELIDLRTACDLERITMLDASARVFSYATPLREFRVPPPPHEAMPDTLLHAVN